MGIKKNRIRGLNLMNLATFSIEIRFKSEYLRISLYFSVYCILLYVIKNIVIAENSWLLHRNSPYN